MKPADMLRLFALSVLWGGSFIFIRVAAPVLGPFILVESRVLIAGVTLLLYAALMKQNLGLRRYWKQYLVIGVVNSALPFVLISTAELHLTASLAAILNSTTPLFGAVIAAIWIKDPLTLRKGAGIVCGIAGVAVLTGLSSLSWNTAVLLSIGASLAAACSYGLAGVFIKAKAGGAPSIGLTVGSQLAASILLAPSIPLTLPTAAPSMIVVLCTLALALLSTALAYVLYFQLVVNTGPLKAMTVTFLAPIFGVLWGALLLNEPVGWGTVLGCSIILAGTGLVTGARLPLLGRSAPGVQRADLDGSRAATGEHRP